MKSNHTVLDVDFGTKTSSWWLAEMDICEVFMLVILGVMADFGVSVFEVGI